MSNKVTALVGVRGGSQRVVDKNGRPFAGTSLLELKVRTLLSVPDIDRVVVNSECPRLLAIAEAAGAQTIIRDSKFASNSVCSSDYYVHIAENCDAEVILSATVTTPLVEPSSFQAGIESYFSRPKNYDSVTSCCSVKEFLYKDGVPLNYNPERQVRSQDLPNIIALNYGYSIIERKAMIEGANVVGKRPLFIELSKVESIDIDTLDDFIIAESVYSTLQRSSSRRIAA